MALHIARSAADALSRRLRRQAEAGSLRRIAPGIYTDDIVSPLEDVVRRELLSILAAMVPGGVISHRSALGTPVNSGSVHLTGPYRRQLDLPGLRVVVRKGPGALPTDIHVPTRAGVAHQSSLARALLENLTISRARSPDERHVLGQTGVEARLETLLTTQGEASLNRLRDDTKAIAPALGLEAEAAKLDQLIGTLLGTRSAKLVHPQAIARQQGFAYDARRVDLFARAAESLVASPPVVPVADPRNAASGDVQLRAFVESYFSNYIEGTEFELEEAHAIVTTRQALAYREDDSHDVIGTFNAILDSIARPVFPMNAEAFAQQLQSWNGQVLFSRGAKRPGQWKEKPNRAGATEFVDPALVRGTLAKGFELVAQATDPAVRAALAMLVVLEVHPFADGNGRTARLALNLALSAAGCVRVIVPTVFREDYVLALKAFSRDAHVQPFSRMLTRAAAFSAWLDYGSKATLFEQLERSHALQDPAEGRLDFPG